VFLQLWSVLEALTGTQNARYDETVRRASFFYKNREREQQILQHLRLRRNQATHHDKQYSDSETIVYQMKPFCEILLLYLINHSSQFANFDEYTQYLDLPTDPDILKQQINLRRLVLRFRKGR